MKELGALNQNLIEDVSEVGTHENLGLHLFKAEEKNSFKVDLTTEWHNPVVQATANTGDEGSKSCYC